MGKLVQSSFWRLGIHYAMDFVEWVKAEPIQCNFLEFYRDWCCGHRFFHCKLKRYSSLGGMDKSFCRCLVIPIALVAFLFSSILVAN